SARRGDQTSCDAQIQSRVEDKGTSTHKSAPGIRWTEYGRVVQQDTDAANRLFTHESSFDVSLDESYMSPSGPPPGISTLEQLDWIASPSPLSLAAAVPALEAGGVLFFPTLQFEVEPSEAGVFTPDILGKSKNASFDPTTGRLAGVRRSGSEGEGGRSDG